MRPTLEERFWHRVEKKGAEDCWLWQLPPRKGSPYGQIAFTTEGKKKVELVHRLSYKLNNGDIPDGKFVLHTCDTPLCVNPKHLIAGTAADNAKHKAERKRGNQKCKKGCKCGRHSKLRKSMV